jgi:hypothetical protein
MASSPHRISSGQEGASAANLRFYWHTQRNETESVLEGIEGALAWVKLAPFLISVFV